MQFKLLVSLFLASAAIAAPIAQPSDLGLGGLGDTHEGTGNTLTKTVNEANSTITNAGNQGNGNGNGNAAGNGNGNGSGSGNSAGNGSGSGNSAGNGNGNGNEIDGNGSDNASPSNFLNNYNLGNIGSSGEAECDDEVEQNGLVNLNVSPCIAL